jgi:hypothetical protein
MRQSVIDIFPSFTERLEGKVSHMYLDCKGLVTVGLGCLIDPVALAVGLPWAHKTTNVRATPQQVVDEWQRLKDEQRLKIYHYDVAGRMTNLRLSDEGIADLAERRLKLFEDDLRKTFAEWDEWPADAQLGLMSMSWAMGSGFTRNWPAFVKACLEHRWVDAALNCSINTTGNVGVIPRNKINKELFLRASLAYGPTDTGYDKSLVSEEAISL